MDFILKGLILGFSIAAPVGPIGLLCIRRTLAQGRLSGFVSGLGAATADGFYGFVAAFGLTAISSLLLDYQSPIRIFGAIFLFYIAIKIFFAKPENNEVGSKHSISLIKSYTSTFLLTITNPSTILSFIAVFAGFGLVTTSQNYVGATLTVAGVFAGSALWWLILSSFVGHFYSRIPDKSLIWVNRVSGILMIGLGIYSLLIW